MPTRSSLPSLTTTDALADGGNPAQTPAFLGYRWPAEWEAHEATWLSWPHNRDTWPGCLEAVEDTFGTIVRELSLRERVCINIANPAMVDRAKVCLQHLQAVRQALAELGQVRAASHVQLDQLVWQGRQRCEL